MPPPTPLAGAVTALLCLSLAGPAGADEGMWPVDDLPAGRWEGWRERGLRLPATAIWDGAGGGLGAAVVRLRGCTGAFLSEDGLIATNHHCVVSALQQHSTPDTNRLRDGFLARRWADELPVTGERAEVLQAVTDVTARLNAALDGVSNDGDRARAWRRAANDLVDACEQPQGTRCEVVSEHGGLRATLHAYLELRDLRLVYAPPDAFGRYGGEVDNYRWPRHSGDFAFLRAYVSKGGAPAAPATGNRPYRPPEFLELSPRGVRPGDALLVLGYPGSTWRWLPAAAVEERQGFADPLRLELLVGHLAELEAAAAAGEEAALAVAPARRRAENRRKRLEGMLAGLAEAEVAAHRRRREAALRARLAASDPRRAAELEEVLEQLQALYRPGPAAERDLLLKHLEDAVPLLAIARTVVEHAAQRELPDQQRRDGHRDRDRERLAARLTAVQKELDPRAGAMALAGAVRMLLERAEGRRLLAQAGLPGAGEPEARPAGPALAEWAQRLHAGSRLDRTEERLAALDLGREELAEAGDAMLDLALRLEPEFEAMEARREAREGALLRWLPPYMDLLRAGGEADYPDASRTLRLAFASVRGYAPGGGPWQAAQTSLAGLLDKETGVPPFDLPGPFRRAATELAPGRWRQASLDSVPLCFLADGDTTGGSSGSPVLDGRGRMVGLNFDRVFENIVGDALYDPSRARHIAVDIRAMLWTLEVVEGAYSLMREMGMEPRAPKPAVDPARMKNASP